MKTIFYIKAPVILFVIIFSFTLFPGCPAVAQTNQWTWVSGDNTAGNAGNYGSKGIAAASNKPGSRLDMATWTDAGGNMWLFGGFGYDASGVNGQLNDLWKYDPVANQWTWISGSTTANANSVYGSKGVASTASQPGGRHYFTTWKDATGNLWLFGGDGNDVSGNAGILNDLWKYDPAANQWTWVGGDNTISSTGIYGTKAVAAPANKPGARRGSTGWTDAGGNLWLFGGDGYSTSPTQETYLNDLWKYDPVANQWTWVSGENTINPVNIYGTKGVAAAANEPGGRWSLVSWTDRNYNLWLFGGKGRTASGSSADLNDLWKYDVAAGQWTWVSGDNVFNADGVYGTIGVADPANKPGARYETVSWTDTNHDLWLFGGDGFDASSGSSYFLNDLWRYNIASNTWTWISGADFGGYPAIYGTKGVAAPGNQPGARNRLASWLTADNTLWIFGGGSGNGFLNDLWTFKPNIVLLATGFLNFTGTCNRNEAVLSWQLPQEHNSGYFNVQRSTDGMHWETRGTVSAANHDAGIGSYRFTDAHPVPGINYYQLQQWDAGGLVYYSKVISLLFRQADLLTWREAGAGRIKLQLQNGGSENFVLAGTDGRIYQRGSLQGGEAVSGPLLPGVYVLQVTTGKGPVTKKIVIR